MYATIFARCVIAASAMIALSNLAEAQCRGPATKDREIYSESLRRTDAAGVPVVATIRYVIRATIEACEESPTGGRVCDFYGRSRSLHRTLTVTPLNGPTETRGEKSFVVSPPQDHHFSYNCNIATVDAPVWDPVFNAAFGTRATWERYIQEDMEDVKRLLIISGLAPG